MFGDAKPRLVVVTTPNAEHNVLFEGLAAGGVPPCRSSLRMDAGQFQDWARVGLCALRLWRPVRGDWREPYRAGAPTQMAVFTPAEAGRPMERADENADPKLLDIPDFSLVVLMGATGSGKSTFAAKWFKPSEVLSSDYFRGLVSDDVNDQAVSADAFDVVRYIAEKRLKNRRLTVIDATNVRAADRAGWVEIARRWHALPVAIVIDPGLDVCIDRNKGRPDRNFGPGVPQRMISELRRGMRGLPREGFRKVWRLTSAQAIDDTVLERRPLWTDRRDDAGPFDIIGDVHGCADELLTLLGALGYEVSLEGGVSGFGAPHGRKAVFVGDLCDRGPRTPDVLRIVMAAVAAGQGYVVQGNHDRKLFRWMDGRNVKIAHGLQEFDRPDQRGNGRIPRERQSVP